MAEPLEFYVNENESEGLSASALYQAGVSNTDSGFNPEKAFLLPYIVNPAYSFIAYQCWIEVDLDSGVALHKPLPQNIYPVDDLGSFALDNSAGLVAATTGVNTTSNWKFEDIAQQMATSTYIFKLRGMAVRIGYQVPIPFLRTVAGVTPIPAERQTAYNMVIGNFGGVPLFRARWDKWYYVTAPPKQAQQAPSNLAAHISALQQLPTQGVAPPFSQPDSNAVPGTGAPIRKLTAQTPITKIGNL